MVADVFTNGRKLVEAGAKSSLATTMPLEFSVAAFRLGHCTIHG